ncbi:MAG: hypothetical protein GY850_06985 [bacterium]|nr:hypothetical protein [bacterium]
MRTKEKIGDTNLQISATQRLLDLFDNFERQIDTFRNEAALDIEKLGLQESQIFSVKLFRKPIIDKRTELIQKKTELEKDLNEDEEGSTANKRSNVLESLKVIQGQLDAPHKKYEEYLERIKAWEKVRASLIGSKDSPGSIEFYKAQIKDLEQTPSDLENQHLHAFSKAREIFREINSLAKTYKELYQPIQIFIDSSPVAKDELQLLFKVEIIDTGFSDTFFSYVSQGVRGSYCGAEEGSKRLSKILVENDLSSEEGVARFLELIVKSLNFDQREGGSETTVADQVKKGQTQQSLYDFIFGLEYLKPKFSLGIAGKDLSELSPDERGALLLVFYLLVDQNDIPLIIDQPEENLDNQTVYRLLVPCIKEAKKRRQILIVTHNPNLAVVCDADQIICCFLDKKNKYRLTYTSGSIENPEINKNLLDILEGTRPAFNNREAKYLKQT